MIVRPFNTYGPRQNDGSYAGIIPLTLRRILVGEPPTIFGDGNQTRDFTFVEDTAALIVAIASMPALDDEPVNVASGNEVSVRELVGALCRYVGYDGEWQWAGERPGDVRRHFAGIQRLRKLIPDYQFVTLDEGLARTVDWYRASKRRPEAS